MSLSEREIEQVREFFGRWDGTCGTLEFLAGGLVRNWAKDGSWYEEARVWFDGDGWFRISYTGW